MDEESLHISLPARQIYSVLTWLSANRSKRGVLLYWSELFTIGAAIIRFIGAVQQSPQSGILVALLLVGSIVLGRHSEAWSAQSHRSRPPCGTEGLALADIHRARKSVKQ